MFSKEDQKLLEQLMESNADFKYIYNKLLDENRLILSRFTHELRNPLTLVKSTLQYIESKYPETTEFKYWNTLGSDIDETVEILDELSVYNHCEELTLETCNLDSMLSALVQQFHPFTLEKNIQLTYHCTEELQNSLTSYSCDPVKLKQTFTNILKNAVEAADRDSEIVTTVSVASNNEGTSDDTYIDITIKNSGTPIPEDELKQIFEPFVTHKTGGTGLGLAIAKKAVTLHCGDISVSQTDTTTSFHILLPLQL